MVKQEVALNNTYGDLVLHPYEHRTKFYETDQTGVIHQTHYMKWLEDARMDIMEQLGLGYKQMQQLQIMCPLLSEAINFTGRIRFDDTIVIETKVAKYDGQKMELDYTMYEKETKDVKATAKTTHCFMNGSGIPISLNRIYPELDTKFFEFK